MLFASLLMLTEESYLNFQVFPLKAELLRPQEEMERHITDLIKKASSLFYYSVYDVYRILNFLVF